MLSPHSSQIRGMRRERPRSLALTPSRCFFAPGRAISRRQVRVLPMEWIARRGPPPLGAVLNAASALPPTHLGRSGVWHRGSGPGAPSQGQGIASRDWLGPGKSGGGSERPLARTRRLNNGQIGEFLAGPGKAPCRRQAAGGPPARLCAQPLAVPAPATGRGSRRKRSPWAPEAKGRNLAAAAFPPWAPPLKGGKGRDHSAAMSVPKVRKRPSSAMKVFSPAGAATEPKGICARSFQLAGTSKASATAASMTGL